MINNINNKEVGSSVRNKLNKIISYVNSPYEIGGSGLSGSYSVTLSDNQTTEYYGFSHSTTSYLNLPNGSNGKSVIIKDETDNASNNNIHIYGSLDKNVNEFIISGDNFSLTLLWVNDSWRII